MTTNIPELSEIAKKWFIINKCVKCKHWTRQADILGECTEPQVSKHPGKDIHDYSCKYFEDIQDNSEK